MGHIILRRLNMANKYSFDGNIGCIKEDVIALDIAGTVALDFSPYNVAEFSVVAESAAGVLVGPSATTFSVAVNRTTKIATITNETGAAYTGSYKIIGVFY